MVAHSTPKAGVERGTQSLGYGREAGSLLSQLATASQTARDDNSIAQADLSSRPERSVAERSAVLRTENS
jgi:hypothetical protein